MKEKKRTGTFTRTRRILTAIIVCCVFCSCGITKATISRPAEGTTTTVTITTNNPITTDVTPELNSKK